MNITSKRYSLKHLNPLYDDLLVTDKFTGDSKIVPRSAVAGETHLAMIHERNFDREMAALLGERT
jgi:hypothetical protein